MRGRQLAIEPAAIPDIRARLLSRTTTIGECLCWTGYCRGHEGNRYGVLYVPGAALGVPRGRYEGAHRVSFAAFHAPLGAGVDVLHRCDNGLCVEPSHLFAGSHADNMVDMWRKGRHRQPRSRLTPADLDRIVNGSEDCRAIAAELGMHYSYIYKLRKRGAP